MRVVMAFFCLVLLALAPASNACTPRDFTTLPLNLDAQPSWVTAILTAYPALSVEGTTLFGPHGSVALTGPTGRSPRDIIANPSIGDQFVFHYTLDRNLSARETPYMDPGRARHGPFFRLLYGSNREEVHATLRTVKAGIGGNARFAVTMQHGVACQLRATFEALNGTLGLDPFFQDVGGSFNWRQIAGTERLSAHSYGIAIDINPNLGGYWRWSGGRVGAAGRYDNKVPWALVEAMERYGFIWGGKWHHFDGMHFEYRPELILFSRIIGGSVSGPYEALQ